MYKKKSIFFDVLATLYKSGHYQISSIFWDIILKNCTISNLDITKNSVIIRDINF